MKSPGDTITELVNAKLIEEVPETAVSDRSHVVADQMLVSLAISVKRIADALDLAGRLPDSVLAHATGNAIAGIINRGIRDGFAAPLNAYGENIGECIQGQMERGPR